jgi:sugar transferase (PEP-CTERM/EpsH1 system associated)
MKVLMVTPRLPYPPNRGDTVRSWAELEYLARRHDVWLASLNDRRPTSDQLAKLRNTCRDLAVAHRPSMASLCHGVRSLFRGDTLTEGYFANTGLSRTIRAWAKSVPFDAVLAFSSAMAPLAELVEARRVLDMCDVDSHKWRVYADQSHPPLRWLYALEAQRLAAAEQRWVRAHDVTLIVNERERRKLLARTSPRGSVVVRTCVQPTDFARPDSAATQFTLPREPIVGCVGSMFYPPNVRAVVWFGQHVWPLVKTSIPSARWWIVGSRPTRQVRRWGRRAGVRVTGSVPDTRPYLDALRVFINPVDGDIGVQSKLLCAMAAGKPAVVTPDTAAGIAFDGEAPFLIAREPDEFADAVLRLLNDDALAARLGRRALRVIEEYYQPGEQLGLIERALFGDAWEGPPRVRRDRNAAPVSAAIEVIT